MLQHEFIERSLNKHNGLYDYSKTIYKNARTKVIIICKIHGEYEQLPFSHLKGSGCKQCANDALKIQYTKTEFIQHCNKTHNFKYDYSDTKYVDWSTKIFVICPIHGKFYINPSQHVKGTGCPKCNHVKITKTNDEFIIQSTIIHNNKYEYSKTNYINALHDVEIICKQHGSFIQNAHSHLQGHGCPICRNESHPKKYTTKTLIEKFKSIHSDLYDYSKVNYYNYTSPVEIICKIHGVFKQTPKKHLMGQGCPMCKKSHGEQLIQKFLTENNISYQPQYRFKNCKYNKILPFDFYLPAHNICIEFDGKQHHKPMSFSSDQSEETKNNNLANIQIRDNIKTEFCYSNNIKLIRITDKKLITDTLAFLLI